MPAITLSLSTGHLLLSIICYRVGGSRLWQLIGSECFSRFNIPKHPRAKNLISKFFPREAETVLMFQRMTHHLRCQTRRGVLLHTSRPCSTWPGQTRGDQKPFTLKSLEQRTLQKQSNCSCSSLLRPTKYPNPFSEVGYLSGGTLAFHSLAACKPTHRNSWTDLRATRGWSTHACRCCLWLQNRTGPQRGRRAMNTWWDSHFHWCCKVPHPSKLPEQR